MGFREEVSGRRAGGRNEVFGAWVSGSKADDVKIGARRVREELGFLLLTQRTQYPLTKEHTLNSKGP